MSSTIRIARRFCGPPETGNGGYSAGMLASLLPGACECTLRKPIPLERDLKTENFDEHARLLADSEVIIEAVPTQLDIDLHTPIAFEQADRAMTESPALSDNHPFPTCVTCGPKRELGDGLRIFPGRLPGADGDNSAFA